MNKKLLLAVPISIVLFIATTLIGYGKFQSVAERAKEDVKKLEEKKDEETEKTEEELKETEEKLHENEKIDIRQSILLERTTDTLNKLNSKLDKLLRE